MNAHVLLKGGRVFTGTEVIEDGFVEIDGPSIRRVGAVRDLTSDLEAEVIDCAGRTVLPGIIDAHAHVLTQAHHLRLTDAAAAVWGAGSLRSVLAAGVTTVRDLGTLMPAIFGLKQALNAGYARGPRLLAAGAAICMTGGHGWHELSVEADGVEAVRQAARRQLKAGADLVKLMATGGAGTPGEPGAPQLTREELRAGVIEAHNAGKPAAAHALGAQGITNALGAGVDSIEHGVFLDDRAIQLMVERGVALCPTLSIYHRIAEWGVSEGVPGFMVEKARAIVEPHSQSFRNAVAAGVKIVFGTDAGLSYYPVGDVADEMRLMAENGMSSLDVLRSATATAARACGVDHVTGTLSSGKDADVLVVEGDLISQLARVRDVRLVFRAGELVRADR